MALEGITIDDLSAPDGAESVFQCLDARFPDLEAHDKIGGSLDEVFRLRVEIGERTLLTQGSPRGNRAARPGGTSWTREKSNRVGSCW